MDIPSLRKARCPRPASICSCINLRRMKTSSLSLAIRTSPLTSLAENADGMVARVDDTARMLSRVTARSWIERAARKDVVVVPSV